MQKEIWLALMASQSRRGTRACLQTYSHLKNSEPRRIGVSEGECVKSTNIGHHTLPLSATSVSDRKPLLKEHMERRKKV